MNLYADIAWSHLLDPETGEYNIPYLDKLVPGIRAVVVNLFFRELGFVIARGNPAGIREFADLDPEDAEEVFMRRVQRIQSLIDPLPVLDEFGTDALRFTLLVGSTPGNDMNLSVKKVEANRNFANKIWNAGRFVISAIASLDKQITATALVKAAELGKLELDDPVSQWVDIHLPGATLRSLNLPPAQVRQQRRAVARRHP